MLAGVLRRRLRGMSAFMFTLLVIEFLDEIIFGTGELVLPVIRDDLGLTYAQIGLLLGLPRIFASLIEPAFGVLADIGYRRLIIIGGGAAFAVSLAGIAGARSFLVLLLAEALFSPASGAFVSLSQATLMDLDPKRHEQNMARWTLAGALGIVIAPLAFAGFSALGLGWRELYAAFALFTVMMIVVTYRQRRHIPENGGRAADIGEEGIRAGFITGLRTAARELRRGEVLRWLALLEFSDLLLDGLHGYLALYFVDAAGTDQAGATLAVAVWTGVGLIGDILLIPLLERMSGLRYLRISVVIELLLYPAFLLAPSLTGKLILLGLIGIFNAGWYSVLAGQLYTSMPGRSGMVQTVGNVFSWIGALIPFGVGLAAQSFGLEAAMWLLWLGPWALLIGLPRMSKPAYEQSG